jgi:hypothetical protein
MHLGQLALRSLALLAILPLAACEDDPTSPATVYVTSSNTQSVRADRGAAPSDVVLNVHRNFSAPATLTLEGVPQGVTITLASPTLAPGVDTTTMSIQAGNAAVPGTYMVFVNATSNGITDRHRVAVLVPGVEIALSTALTIIDQGETQALGVTVTGHANTAVNWSSSNTAVATVSPTGVVTAVGGGIATITATSVADATKSASATVRVPLTSGVVYSGLSAATGADLIFLIRVPTGSTKLSVTLSGGTGDADLYLGFNAIPPLSTAAACNSWNDGNEEACEIPFGTRTPTLSAGLWYIRVNAWSAFTGLTLQATVE